MTYIFNFFYPSFVSNPILRCYFYIIVKTVPYSIASFIKFKNNKWIFCLSFLIFLNIIIFNFKRIIWDICLMLMMKMLEDTCLMEKRWLKEIFDDIFVNLQYKNYNANLLSCDNVSMLLLQKIKFPNTEKSRQ